jgi:hypothetical protein
MGSSDPAVRSEPGIRQHRICYLIGMQDYDLSQIAIDKLIRLSKEVGTPVEDRPEFNFL